MGSTHSDGNTVPQTVIRYSLSGSSFSYSLQSVGIQRLIRASLAQAATISSSSGEKSVLDKFPSSVLDLTALLFRLGVMTVGKEGLGFFGCNPYSQFFLHHPVLCLQPGRLVRPCRLASTATVDTGRRWLFSGCSVELLTLSSKRNIFWD